MTDVTSGVNPLEVARTWTDYLVDEGLLCPRDCCTAIYGRTLLMTMRYFNNLTDEAKVEALDALKKIYSTDNGTFLPIFTWDGLFAVRHRSKNDRRKSVLRLRGEELIARSRTTKGR